MVCDRNGDNKQRQKKIPIKDSRIKHPTLNWNYHIYKLTMSHLFLIKPEQKEIYIFANFFHCTHVLSLTFMLLFCCSEGWPAGGPWNLLLSELYCVYWEYCGWKLWRASVMMSRGFIVSLNSSNSLDKSIYWLTDWLTERLTATLLTSAMKKCSASWQFCQHSLLN